MQIEVLPFLTRRKTSGAIRGISSGVKVLDQESGIRDLGSGIRDQGSGISQLCFYKENFFEIIVKDIRTKGI